LLPLRPPRGREEASEKEDELSQDELQKVSGGVLGNVVKKFDNTANSIIRNIS
jgi:bacteriocin-like protein